MQSGEEVLVGVPLDYEAGPELGGATCVKVVDGFVLSIAQGADAGLVRPPFFPHPGGDGIVYQLKGMVTQAGREGLRKLSGVFNYFFRPSFGGIVPDFLAELIRQGV